MSNSKGKPENLTPFRPVGDKPTAYRLTTRYSAEVGEYLESLGAAERQQFVREAVERAIKKVQRSH